MNDAGRKKLRSWLQTSLASHSEGGNGLVDYVEAIVGDGEGEDDDLREKWTEKLDDFLAESSADFANVLLNGIRSGNFSKSWRGGGGGGGEGEDPNVSVAHADEASKGASDASGGRLEAMDFREEDEPDDVVGDDDDDEDDEDGGRSRRNRRRQWEEPSEATKLQVTDNGGGAEGDGGGRNKGQSQDQEARSNKRARVEGTAGGRGGRGNGVNSRNGGPNSTKGSRGGQQGGGHQAPGNKGVGPSVAGRGQAPGNKGVGHSAAGRGPQAMGSLAGFGQGPLAMGGGGPGGPPGYWGPDMMNAGRGPGGMHQESFGPPGPIGPNGMRPLIGGPGMPMGGPGMPGGSLGMPGMGRGMPQGGPGMTVGRPMMPGVGPGMEARGPGMHGRGPGVEARGPGMHGRGPGVEARGHGMHGRGPGVEARGPGMHGRGPGVEARGPGMNGRGPTMEARGPGIHGRGPGVEARGPGIPGSGHGMPRGGPGMPHDEPGMPRGGPGVPRDTPGMPPDRLGMPRDAPGMPKERGSGMPAGRGNSGKPMQLEAGINGSRRVGGRGLLPTPQAPIIGPPRGVRGPPLLSGPPPASSDGPGNPSGRRGPGPVDPRESMGPGDGRIAGGGDGAMARRSPERRSPSSGPPSGGQRGPVAGEGQGVGLSQTGPPERRQGDVRNGEQGRMRAPEGLFEASDPARQDGGRLVDRPSEHNTIMPRIPDSRGPGMRQGGGGGPVPVPEDLSGGENSQGIRRSVFDRLGARPSEDDAIGQQGRDSKQEQHQQQQRSTMPESFRAGPTTHNLPENAPRNTSNSPTGGQGGHRVMPTGGRGPPHMNAQAGRGGGQGSWSGPPALRSNQQHDDGRVGSGVATEFNRGGASGGMGPELRRYQGEGLGRGITAGEPRRMHSPTRPDARGPVPGHPARNQHGSQVDGRGSVQQQGNPETVQGQARRPPLERREVEHVSSVGGGYFDGGSFRQVGGVGPGRGHDHRQGVEDRGHVGGRPQQGIEDGYPRERQQVQRGVPFHGSVSGRGGEISRDGGLHTGDSNSRPWRQSEVIDGSVAGGSRSALPMEMDHSRNHHHHRQRGAILQQDSSAVARDAGFGQRGGIGEDGGLASWGKNPGQEQRRDQHHQVEWNRRNPHESHGIQSNRGPTHAPGPRSSGPPVHFALQHGGDCDQVQTRRHDRDRLHGWSERGQNKKIQEHGAGRASGTQLARSPSLSGPRVTVRVSNVPADIGQATLLQHFESFGEVVAISLRSVKLEESGKGQKEALVQFGSPRQAQVCLSSPKAVADNRFIVVQPSDVNLVEVDPSFKEQSSSMEKEAVVSKMESAAASKAEEAAAAIVSRKLAQEKLLAQASKTKEVVAQQKLLILLRERVKIATQELEATKTRRIKVQKFLKMMEDKHKPESEQIQYREKLADLSNKISALEAAAEIGEVHAQARKLEELEAEARSIGATVPPPPNADVLAKLMHVDGSNGRGKGHGATSTAAVEPRGSRSLDNRPTTVKVSGLPEGAGEGDLRVHANMAGVLLGAAMLDRPGEGVVKFAERWAAENFMAKSRSFGGIPLSMSWYTGPFPPVQQRQYSAASKEAANMNVAPYPPQQPRTVVLNPDTEDRIELKLAPVQEGYDGAGGQAGSGSRSWGDNLGKKEVVAWGEAGGTGHGSNDGGAESGGSNGSSSGSPLQLPRLQGGQDDDEVYQNMGF